MLPLSPLLISQGDPISRLPKNVEKSTKVCVLLVPEFLYLGSGLTNHLLHIQGCSDKAREIISKSEKDINSTSGKGSGLQDKKFFSFFQEAKIYPEKILT